jgi:hypothetical protein
MGRRDPRMTLRVYTDVTGMQPKTRMGGLLGDEEWAPLGTSAQSNGGQEDKTASETGQKCRICRHNEKRERRDSNPRPPA